MIRHLRQRIPVALVLGLLGSSRAMAQSATAQDVATPAETLFEQGRRDLAAGRFERACQLLRQSDALDPAPGTKLNLGECEARRGRVATAWELFRSVEAQLLPDDIRFPVARSKREALESRLAHLVLLLSDTVPREARVFVGQRSIGRTELGQVLILDPGAIVVKVTAPGYRELRRHLTLEEGKTQTVVMSLERLPPSRPLTIAPRAPGVNPPIAIPNAPASSRKTGFGVLSVGIGGAIVAGVAGLFTLDAKRTNNEHCSDATNSCDQLGRDAASQGRVYGAITTAGLIVGGLGIGIGTYLIVQGHNRTLSVGSLNLRSDAMGARLSFERTF